MNQVADVMTRDVRVASPGQSIRDVAKIMAEIDAGARTQSWMQAAFAAKGLA